MHLTVVLYRTWLSGLLGGLIALNCATAIAQAVFTDPHINRRAHARVLGKKGLAALDARHFKQAERYLSEAIELYPTPTFYQGRAEAREAEGDLLGAWNDLQTVQTLPSEADDTGAFRRAQAVAQARLPILRRRIGRLVVTVEGGQAAVWVDGEQWPADLLGQVVAVTAGAHRIEARNQLATQTTTVEVAAGDKASVHFADASGADGADSVAAEITTSHTTVRLAALVGGIYNGEAFGWTPGAEAQVGAVLPSKIYLGGTLFYSGGSASGTSLGDGELTLLLAGAELGYDFTVGLLTLRPTLALGYTHMERRWTHHDNRTVNGFYGSLGLTAEVELGPLLVGVTSRISQDAGGYGGLRLLGAIGAKL